MTMLRHKLRRAARAALRRDDPKVSQLPLRLPYRLPDPLRRHRGERPSGADLRRTLDFLLRLGELLLRSGAGSVDVEATIIACAMAFGLRDVEASVTNTEILVSVAVDENGTPLTDLRNVRVRAVDHSRLVALHEMVLNLTEGRLSPEEAYKRLDEIVHAPKRYPRWGVTIAWATLATAVSVQLGGNWLHALVTFVSAGVIDRLGRRLARRNIPDFYLNFIGAALVTGVAVGLTAAGAPLQPALVVAGGVVLLLPGLALLSCVQDALTGFVVTAAGRLVDVLILAAGIISGVAAALIVARQAGLSMPVQPPAPFTLTGLPPQFISAGIVAAAMSFGLYAPLRVLPFAFLLGGSGYVAFLSINHLLAAPSMSRGLVAVVLGVCGHAIATRYRLPALTVVLPAIIPMLPGLTIYGAMLELTQGDRLTGIGLLLQAGTDALALAAGVILGEFLGQPLRRPLTRKERRYAGPRLLGPMKVRADRPALDVPHQNSRGSERKNVARSGPRVKIPRQRPFKPRGRTSS
ncbi:MAG TPA: threonine/serine exporter family protein [Actinopolymorphaceae bacterium]